MVSWATDALDQVSRGAWPETRQPGKSQLGRPANGASLSKKNQAKSVKNIHYTLLKNQKHLSENPQAQLQFFTKANPKLYRVYLLKENLRLALKAGPDEIPDALTKWMA